MMMKPRIAIASEHAGFKLKEYLKKALENDGYTVNDMGTDSDTPADYPYIAEKLSKSIMSVECDFGILICGTGIGMSIAANKVDGIRAALCTDIFSVRYTRLHNDANILCLGAWITAEKLSYEMVIEFLTTGFAGGRHSIRIEKLMLLETRR